MLEKYASEKSGTNNAEYRSVPNPITQFSQTPSDPWTSRCRKSAIVPCRGLVVSLHENGQKVGASREDGKVT